MAHPVKTATLAALEHPVMPESLNQYHDIIYDFIFNCF